MKSRTKREIQGVWQWLKWAYALGVTAFLYILLLLISISGEAVSLPLWCYVLMFFSLLILWFLFEWIHSKLHSTSAKPGVYLLMKQIVLSLASSMLLFWLAYLVAKLLIVIDAEAIVLIFASWTFLSMLTVSLLVGSYLIIHWKQSAVETQQLKKETALANYNALKSQINPHFIFNSLNTLHSLIYDDPRQAALFLEQLSEILRYTLQNRNTEVVTAREELTVTEAYLRLFKSRFGKLFEYTLERQDRLEDFHIVSLTLPTLVENVFKHNVLSEQQPILISIRKNGDYLTVENTKGAPKAASHSLGVGLSNIRERYQLLGSEPMLIEETASTFRVKIPLLYITAYEDSNH